MVKRITSSSKMDTKLLKDLKRSTNEVRKKFKAIKSGKIDTEAILEETFKPISKPLKEISKTQTQMKSDIVDKIKSELSELKTEVSPKKSMKQENNISYDTSFETPRTSASTTLLKRIPLSESTPLQRSLTKSFVDDDDDGEHLASYYAGQFFKNNVDKAYGPKFNKETNEFKLGRSKFLFNENTIKIGEDEYKATPGLYELIFMKKPTSYTPDDLEKYKEILLKTNVYRKNVNDEHSQIKGTGGKKYTHIIGKLIQKKKGKGMMQFQTEKPNYIYWDDPNELVERLKLLIASQEAGHTNHNNEIISIIEELREANIIV